MAYIYRADIWCDACGDAIKADLDAKGERPECSQDEYTFDSDDYPKPADDDEATDSPQHCGAGEACLNALEFDHGMCGALIGNNLTEYGVEWLRERLAEESRNDYQEELYEFWRTEFAWANLDVETDDEDDTEVNDDDDCDDDDSA